MRSFLSFNSLLTWSNQKPSNQNKYQESSLKCWLFSKKSIRFKMPPKCNYLNSCSCSNKILIISNKDGKLLTSKSLRSFIRGPIEECHTSSKNLPLTSSIKSCLWRIVRLWPSLTLSLSSWQMPYSHPCLGSGPHLPECCFTCLKPTMMWVMGSRKRCSKQCSF